MCFIDYVHFGIFNLTPATPFNHFPLSQILCYLSRLSFRACHEALSAMEIPNDLLQVIQDLLLELRVHCLMVTLLHTTEGEQEQ